MLDSLFIFGAKYLSLLIIAISGVVFFTLPRNTQKQMILLSCVSMPLIYFISIIAAHFYYDPRPFVVGNFTPLIPHIPDNGFPSDHVLLTFSMAALFLTFLRKVSYILFPLVVVVAVSRVYVGVHHSIDVFGSFLIVSIGMVAAHLILKHVRQNSFIRLKSK